MREHKFERAPKAVDKLAAEIIAEFHKPLKESKVKIDFIFCRAETDSTGKTKSFALKRNGKQILGMANIVPLLDRVMGRADAQIKIDADWYEKEETTDDQRRALLDHELTHFEIKKDEVDAPQSDDIGRPVLQIREHDWEISGFKSVAERYGAASLEVMAAQRLQQQAGQILFQFELVNIVEETPEPAAATG